MIRKEYIFGNVLYVCNVCCVCNVCVTHACNFWLIWFINQRASYNHALCVGILCQCWCQHWHWYCLCIPLLATGLNIKTSYLVHICTYVPHICTSNIFLF